MPTSWEDALTLARQHSEQQGEKWVFRWGSFDIVADNKRELVALLAQALGERRERDGGVAPPEPPVPTAEEIHALARSHGMQSPEFMDAADARMMADFAARKSSEKIPEPCKVTYRIAGPDDPIYSGGLRVTSRPASRPSTATSQPGTDGISDPMQPGIDAHEAAMAARRAKVDAEKAAQGGASDPSSKKKQMPSGMTYRIAGPDHPIYSGGLRVTSRPVSRPSSATSRTGTDGTSQQDLDESENQADSPEQAIRAEAQRRLRTTRMAAKGQTPPSTK